MRSHHLIFLSVHLDQWCKNGLFDSPSPLSLSPATAAAQTQMPSTKPKARTLVTCRQLSDGGEAASLRDQSPPPLLVLKGTASVTSTDPRGIPSIRASITLEERKQQIKRERGSNAVDEQKHNETMQQSVWGMPGSGAPNYHLGTVKRTKSLHAAGILPQEQVNNAPFITLSIVPCNKSPVYSEGLLIAPVLTGKKVKESAATQICNK
ncbi:uncharacterized protein LOC126397391 isoform X1 [Epinephelus moara]|uniref:uncharacterized protein LOC126397391 isoform X1 n=1 Tax=Epinephelus moara TaxID=300413 RepID=UPI00214F1DB1|nr:uncharacterized protein LOC126397391 isoform X1 [Epinephelus moara]